MIFLERDNSKTLSANKKIKVHSKAHLIGYNIMFNKKNDNNNGHCVLPAISRCSKHTSIGTT